MRSLQYAAAILCLATALALPIGAPADEFPSWNAVEAVSIAIDAYIYG
jgi:hypothetical protein